MSDKPMHMRGAFETEHGRFASGEECVYIDPNGKEWPGTIGEVLPDGEADFVGNDWSRGGTYKWRSFRKAMTSPTPMALEAKALEAGRSAAHKSRGTQPYDIDKRWADEEAGEAAIRAYLADLPPPAAGEGLEPVAQSLGFGEASKAILALMDDFRSRAPFGQHEPGSPYPSYKTPLILHNDDIGRLLDKLLDAAMWTDRAERRLCVPSRRKPECPT